MKIVWIILTYQRPKILSVCLNTLFNNTKIKPDSVWIIDDCSDITLKQELFNISKNYSESYTPINLILAGKNRGIGYSFEMAYNIMRQDEDNSIYCFIESDYIWKKGWLEDVVTVFKASPLTIAIAGTDHPDMYNKIKTHQEFPKLMIDQFGKDLDSREYLYKPFFLETERGKIQVQGVSNSCGCQIVHWGRLKNILRWGDFAYNSIPFSTNTYWKWMDRAFNKNNTGNRKDASDMHMSQTIAMFAEKFMIYFEMDITKNFGFLSICDYSISQHVCGMGKGGMNIEEGSTFIFSPTWKNEYLENDPREIK